MKTNSNELIAFPVYKHIINFLIPVCVYSALLGQLFSDP